MTVAGQKNHYNVKLLKVYGVSINLKDSRLCLKGGRDPFTGEQETEEWFVSQIPYVRIVVSGKGYLSTETVKLLTDHNINILLTDTYGNLVTAMHKVMSSPTATSYRIAQYDTFQNPEKVIPNKKKWLIIIPPRRRPLNPTLPAAAKKRMRKICKESFLSSLN
jgi:CRISP-associated protein Cas1